MKNKFRIYCLSHGVTRCADIYVDTLEGLSPFIFVNDGFTENRLNAMHARCTNGNQIPAYNKFINFLEAPTVNGGMGMTLSGVSVKHIPR